MTSTAVKTKQKTAPTLPNISTRPNDGEDFWQDWKIAQASFKKLSQRPKDLKEFLEVSGEVAGLKAAASEHENQLEAKDRELREKEAEIKTLVDTFTKKAAEFSKEKDLHQTKLEDMSTSVERRLEAESDIWKQNIDNANKAEKEAKYTVKLLQSKLKSAEKDVTYYKSEFEKCDDQLKDLEDCIGFNQADGNM
jgi:chromosome segregation ATPase